VPKDRARRSSQDRGLRIEGGSSLPNEEHISSRAVWEGPVHPPPNLSKCGAPIATSIPAIARGSRRKVQGGSHARGFNRFICHILTAGAPGRGVGKSVALEL